MVAVGRGGERVIPAEDFFVDTFQTALKPTELLREILVPFPSAHTGNAYLMLERGAGAFPVVGVAAQVTLDGQGTCESAGIGLTAAGPKVLRSKRAEAFLQGKKLGEKEIREAAILDGKAVKSCTVLAVQADGKEILTVEGLVKNGKLHPIQEGFLEKHGLQC